MAKSATSLLLTGLAVLASASIAAQGASSNGAASHDVVGPVAVAQSSETQGSGTQGSGTQGGGTQGSGTQGSGTQGSGTQSNGTQDSETQGPSRQGPAQEQGVRVRKRKKPVRRQGSRAEVTPEVEAATKRGLAFLASQQLANGAFPADVGFKIGSDYRVTAEDAAHLGITGLAVMAFLACGETVGRGKYGKNLERAVEYLCKTCQENGYLTDNGTRMYSHAFATLALAEVYGMTTNKEVRDVLQRSVNLISDSQNSEGGWRYKPFATDSDMSITVCQVMALRAARNSGISVSPTVIEKAVENVRQSARQPGEESRRSRRRRWGRRSRRPFDNGVFKYQLRWGSRSSFALTAAGVVTLHGAGIYDDPLIDQSVEFLVDNFEEHAQYYHRHLALYYGNYYAVQALFVRGGSAWRRYYRGMRDYFLARQNGDGSWECRIGPGSTFATSIATLVLAIPYQYLPIFQR